MQDSFSQLCEYFRLIDEFNALSSAKYQYDHQNPEDIIKTELRELAEQIEEKKREIRRSFQ